MKNVSDKSCRETRNTYLMFNNFFFFRKLWHLWDKVEKYKRAGESTDETWRMRVACWIPKATNTHTGCVILIALPLQQSLHERASLLRHTYIACLVKTSWHLISMFPEKNFGSFIPLCWPVTANSYILPDNGQCVWQKHVVGNNRRLYRFYVLCLCGLYLLVCMFPTACPDD